MKTIIIDIDGTILPHLGSMRARLLNPPNHLLPGVEKKFKEWDERGYKIILITGRRESSRELTERTLQALGLFWDELIMGLGRGTRVLINDTKSDGQETAIAINIKRDAGLEDIDV